MKTSKTIEVLIKKYIADEISENELLKLQQAAEKNQEIAELLDLHKQFSNSQMRFEEPTQKEFESIRNATINAIRQSKRKRWFFTFPDFQSIFYRPAFGAVLAILLFFAGYTFSAWFTKDPLITDITRLADHSTSLQSSINSPYIFSNAKLRQKPDGRFSVSVDVSRHLEIEAKQEDPLVREILAQSLLNTTSSHKRLENIESTEHIMAPKIKQALILTMLNDSNPVVRQKSMLSLMQYKNDTEIQDALLKVLNEEESVYMRLTAIDYLSNNTLDKALLEEQFKRLTPQNNAAIDYRIKQIKH